MLRLWNNQSIWQVAKELFSTSVLKNGKKTFHAFESISSDVRATI